MSNAASFLRQGRRIRLLVYGDPKTQKTWWTCLAAKAGYNVLLVDGDDGCSILSTMLSIGVLDEKDLSHIYIINAVDKEGVPVFMNFAHLMAGETRAFLWDNDVRARAFETKPEHSFVSINTSKLTSNDVLVFDSWKALSWSVKTNYALTQHLNLADASRDGWEGYGYESRFLDCVMNWFHRLECHVVIIDHNYEYDKRNNPKPGEQSKILWSKTLPVSSSSNHSFSMLSHLTDIVWFHRLTSASVYISTTGDLTRIGGCRHHAPGDFRLQDIKIADFFNAVIPFDPAIPLTAFHSIDRGAPVERAPKADPLPAAGSGAASMTFLDLGKAASAMKLGIK